MKSKKLFILFSLFAIHFGCEDSVTPVSPSVLMESSFEQNGQPSFDGWRDGFPTYGYSPAIYSFSSDTSPNGGSWALKSVTPDSSFTVLRFPVKPVQPSNYKNFKLSFWSKTDLRASNFSVLLISYSGNQSIVKPVICDSSSWKMNTLSISSNELTIDSLVIHIAMYSVSESSKIALFDDFRLEQY